MDPPVPMRTVLSQIDPSAGPEPTSSSASFESPERSMRQYSWSQLTAQTRPTDLVAMKRVLEPPCATAVCERSLKDPASPRTKVPVPVPVGVGVGVTDPRSSW